MYITKQIFVMQLNFEIRLIDIKNNSIFMHVNFVEKQQCIT